MKLIVLSTISLTLFGIVLLFFQNTFYSLFVGILLLCTFLFWHSIRKNNTLLRKKLETIFCFLRIPEHVRTKVLEYLDIYYSHETVVVPHLTSLFSPAQLKQSSAQKFKFFTTKKSDTSILSSATTNLLSYRPRTVEGTSIYDDQDRLSGFSSQPNISLRSSFSSPRDRNVSIKTCHAAAGPTLASTRFRQNLDYSVYADVNSPGFSERIASYHQESNSEIPGSRFSSPGHFPAVKLVKDSITPISLSCRPKGRLPGVRIAPLLLDYKSSSSVIETPQDDSQGKTSTPTHSVLDALKEISRKRIRGGEAEVDSKKRHKIDERDLSSNDDNVSTKTAVAESKSKRHREVSPEKSALTNQPNQPAKRRCYNEFECSLSSSRNLRMAKKRNAWIIDGEHPSHTSSKKALIVTEDLVTVPSTSPLNTGTGNVSSSTVVEMNTLKMASQKHDDLRKQMRTDFNAPTVVKSLTPVRPLFGKPMDPNTKFVAHKPEQPKFATVQTEEASLSPAAYKGRDLREKKFKALMSAINNGEPAPATLAITNLQSSTVLTCSVASPVTSIAQQSEGNKFLAASTSESKDTNQLIAENTVSADMGRALSEKISATSAFQPLSTKGNDKTKTTCTSAQEAQPEVTAPLSTEMQNKTLQQSSVPTAQFEPSVPTFSAVSSESVNSNINTINKNEPVMKPTVNFSFQPSLSDQSKLYFDSSSESPLVETSVPTESSSSTSSPLSESQFVTPTPVFNQAEPQQNPLYSFTTSKCPGEEQIAPNTAAENMSFGTIASSMGIFEGNTTSVSSVPTGTISDSPFEKVMGSSIPFATVNPSVSISSEMNTEGSKVSPSLMSFGSVSDVPTTAIADNVFSKSTTPLFGLGSFGDMTATNANNITPQQPIIPPTSKHNVTPYPSPFNTTSGIFQSTQNSSDSQLKSVFGGFNFGSANTECQTFTMNTDNSATPTADVNNFFGVPPNQSPFQKVATSTGISGFGQSQDSGNMSDSPLAHPLSQASSEATLTPHDSSPPASMGTASTGTSPFTVSSPTFQQPFAFGNSKPLENPSFTFNLLESKQATNQPATTQSFSFTSGLNKPEVQVFGFGNTGQQAATPQQQQQQAPTASFGTSATSSAPFNFGQSGPTATVSPYHFGPQASAPSLTVGGFSIGSGSTSSRARATPRRRKPN